MARSVRGFVAARVRLANAQIVKKTKRIPGELHFASSFFSSFHKNQLAKASKKT
jgi:hypothetical protein